MPAIPPVIIKPSNRDRVERCLREARGSAHARALSYADLEVLVTEVETSLDPLPKAQRVGATAVLRAGNVVSWNYNTAEEDEVRLARRSGGWAVVGLRRVRCGTGFAYSSRQQVVRVDLSSEQFAAWAERIGASRGVTVRAPDDPHSCIG